MELERHTIYKLLTELRIQEHIYSNSLYIQFITETDMNFLLTTITVLLPPTNELMV